MARKADVKLLAIARDLHSPNKEGMAQSVVNRILDLVRTGMLRAGDRLPSERELIDILDISRPTLSADTLELGMQKERGRYNAIGQEQLEALKPVAFSIADNLIHDQNRKDDRHQLKAIED